MFKKLVFSSFFILLLFILLCTPAYSEENPDSFTDQLVQKAFDMKLYEDKYWHILLHYEKSLCGLKSQIDEPVFFLDPDGKYNPKAELEASIRTFFNTWSEDDVPDVCPYLARYDWLMHRLDVDSSKVRILSCESIERINPLKAYLVFPSASINNPASMFGHTFINIKTENKSDLLAHAVNYAARAEESNGIFFAFGALFGLYKGDYSVLPYYKKILEYTDMDKRDIWEYELNLDEAELKKMVRHIREMEKVNIDYYFFDDNCAYNILYLVDAARPSLDLAGKSWIFTIPSDTVVDAFEAGIITGRNFRPSKATRIRQKMKSMDKNLQTAAFDMRAGRLDPGDIEKITSDRIEKMRVFDLASDVLQYDYLAKKIEKKDYSSRLVNVLKHRSRLGQADSGMYDFPQPNPPELCHRPKRITFGAGSSEGDQFYEIGLRFAYSDVCDPDYSMDAGSQVQFGNTRLRYETDKSELAIEQLDIIDLLSLSPVDSFFKPVSWNIHTGFKKEMTDEEGKRELLWETAGGAGISGLFAERILAYFLFQARFDADDSLENGWAGGGGFTTGFLCKIADSYRMTVEGDSIWFAAGNNRRFSIKNRHRIRLARNIHFGFDVKKEFAYDFDRSEISASIDAFF